MRKYPSQKASATVWTDEIPSHWKTFPLKRFAQTILGKMLTPEERPGYVQLPYLRAQNIRWFEPDLTDVKEMWFSLDEAAKLSLQTGDLLVSEGGEVGRTCYWNGQIDKCCVQNSVHIVRVSTSNLSRYFLYQFSTIGKTGHFDASVNRISIAHLTGEKLKEVRFVIPPLSEQTQIVAYLDEKTALIDETIRKKQRLIELLQEERIALINQAVTKGLDPQAPMKVSGVEWLGPVPASWKVTKLGHILSFLSYGFTSPMPVTSEGIRIVTAVDIRDEEVDYSSTRFTSIEAAQALTDKCKPKRNDILITKDGTLGRIAVYDGKFPICINQSVAILRVIESVIDPKLIASFLQAEVYQRKIVEEAGGTTIKHIYISRLSKMTIAFPARKEEQKELSRQLELIVDKRQRIIERLFREVELLQEYRSALINEVVTGKVCVLSEEELEKLTKDQELVS